MDARLTSLTLLNLQQIVFSTVGDTAQFVEFLTDTIANDSALLYQLRRVVLHFLLDALTKLLTETQALPHPLQRLVCCLLTSIFDGFNSLEGHLQLYHLTRRHASCSHLRYNTLQVTNVL